VRPWHFQWIATYYLYRRFSELLPALGGRVLDVGCGDKPYRSWFGVVTEYVGLDVAGGANVDVVVSASESWPFPEDHFDVLFSSQVLEHVESLDHTLFEMRRVLRKGGSIMLAIPFLYNEHGTPYDYRRLTVNGVAQLFPGLEIIRLEKIGGIGSTLVLLMLNWLSNFRYIKVMLPIWIPLSLVLNVLGLLMDRMDRTGAFYNNLLMVVKKPS